VNEIEDKQLATMVNIYPNPVLNGTDLQIESHISEPIQISLFNSSGQLISYQEGNATGRATINMNSLSNGLYYVKILTRDGRFYTSKIILN